MPENKSLDCSRKLSVIICLLFVWSNVCCFSYLFVGFGDVWDFFPNLSSKVFRVFSFDFAGKNQVETQGIARGSF